MNNKELNMKIIDFIKDNCFTGKASDFRLSGKYFAMVFVGINDADSAHAKLASGINGKKKNPDAVLTACLCYEEDFYLLVLLRYRNRHDVKGKFYYDLVDEPTPFILSSTDGNECTRFLMNLSNMLDEDSLYYPELNEVNWLRGFDILFNKTLSELATCSRGPYYKKNRREWDGFHLVTWNGDDRCIAADEIRRVLFLEDLGVSYHDSKHLSMPYCYGVTLDDIDHKLVREDDMIDIRIEFAFRYILGMRNNRGSSIYIIDGEPISYENVFHSGHVLGQIRAGRVTDKDCSKWFDNGALITDYVKLFPVWRNLRQINPDETGENEDIPETNCLGQYQCPLRNKVEEVCREISDIGEKYNTLDISALACRRIRSIMPTDIIY